MTQSLKQLSINTIRGLSIDAVQKANSGHPGLPLGVAPMAYTLWMQHLMHNPKNPKWFNRDRFILSAGHGSVLLYSLLHLTGYDLSLEELKNFRQWGSKTPGHPENVLTPGVEMATGPLGQGIASSVGMAIAEAYLAATFNKPNHKIVDHYTYVICSDGDLMEGVCQEACSLAGHLKLGKLIALYDDNKITIDGTTDIAFTEDVAKRYEAYGWQIICVNDGNDIEAIDQAIVKAKQNLDQPTLIICKTTIGFGSPNKANSPKAHGSPLGSEEVRLTKQALGLPEDKDFYVSEDVQKSFSQSVTNGREFESNWERSFEDYKKAYSTEGRLLENLVKGDFGQNWVDRLPKFSDEKLATRKTSEMALNAVAKDLPTLIGGSADLAESVFATLKDYVEFQPSTRDGRNIAFGVREHAMAAMVNGITLHGGCKSFGGTFLIFSDYCRPSLRLAALMECPSIFVFSHDSIGLGEDGPTHQPIEQLMSLRMIPNFNVMRPADGNETSICWKLALESKCTPSAIISSRQGLPTLSTSNLKDHPAEKGAYILTEAGNGKPQVCLVATGSEVSLAQQAQKLLESEGIATRLVSMPSWFIFDNQTCDYKESVLPKHLPTVSVEAGTTLGWAKYADAHVGIDHFGASAPGDLVMKEFGFTAENIAAVAKALLEF
jgi:transketolase